MRLVFVAAATVIIEGCSSEARLCRRMEKLCGTSAEDCRTLATEAQENFGDAGLKTLGQCFADENTCSSAMGCVAGSGLKSLGKAAGDFLDALGRKATSP
jgi:hypothetical protein